VSLGRHADFGLQATKRVLVEAVRKDVKNNDFADFFDGDDGRIGHCLLA
jgi:hypothetical protein